MTLFELRDNCIFEVYNYAVEKYVPCEIIGIKTQKFQKPYFKVKMYITIKEKDKSDRIEVLETLCIDTNLREKHKPELQQERRWERPPGICGFPRWNHLYDKHTFLPNRRLAQLHLWGYYKRCLWESSSEAEQRPVKPWVEIS